LPRVLVWDGTRLEALLLDLDDTLLDNRAGVEAAQDRLAVLLAERLGDVGFADVRAAFDAASQWFWGDEARHRWGRLDMSAARRVVVERLLAALGRPDARLAAEGADLYTELRDAQYVLFEGALEALARLRARAPALGLVTNGAALAQRAKIERFDLARFFDVIVVEGEFGTGKPDARVFAHALGAVGAAPETALMAGDNYRCDVLGALGAGLHAVWIDRDRRGEPPLLPPRPHRTLASFVELVEELGA
jgi:putative hydrolase of the HAD superfamily